MDDALIAKPLTQKAKLAEIAKLAGVGTATVDRVLHNRPHVSSATRQCVLQAKAAIESGSQSPTRATPWRLKVLLPQEAGPSTEYLASCFQEVGKRGNAIIECVFSKKLEPAALSRKLRACAGQGVDAVAFQALDDPRVRSAIEELAALNIPTLTLISDIASPSKIGFVGLDNRAAGRTAGYLMGRLTRQAGPVIIVSSGHMYRVHEEREMGFGSLARQDFPHLDIIASTAGQDDIQLTYRSLLALLNQYPDLVGIYSVGGANEGVVKAVTEAGIADEIVLIGHNLTPKTETYLLDGSMDIVLHQNMKQVAELAVKSILAHLERQVFKPSTVPVEVITRENIVGTTFG